LPCSSAACRCWSASRSGYRSGCCRRAIDSRALW
jgi:hypothetical protein